MKAASFASAPRAPRRLQLPLAYTFANTCLPKGCVNERLEAVTASASLVEQLMVGDDPEDHVLAETALDAPGGALAGAVGVEGDGGA